MKTKFDANDNAIKNFIDDMTSLEEVVTEMKKIGTNYLKSNQLEARLLADWMYRFGIKIEKLAKSKKHISSVNKFIRTLEEAAAVTQGSRMRFK